MRSRVLRRVAPPTRLRTHPPRRRASIANPAVTRMIYPKRAGEAIRAERTTFAAEIAGQTRLITMEAGRGGSQGA